MKLKIFKIIWIFLWTVMLSFPAHASERPVQKIVHAVKTQGTKKAILFVFAPAEAKETDIAIENLRIQLTDAGIDLTDKQTANNIAKDFEISPEGLNDDIISQIQILLGKTAIILIQGQGEKIEIKVYDVNSGKLSFKNTYGIHEWTIPEVKVPPPLQKAKPPLELPGISGPEITTQTIQELGKKSDIKVPESQIIKKRKNFMGIGAGIANFKKNFKIFDTMAKHNPGARSNSEQLNFHLSLFYELKLSDKYTLGVNSGFEKTGKEEYTLKRDKSHDKPKKCFCCFIYET